MILRERKEQMFKVFKDAKNRFQASGRVAQVT